MTQHAASIPLLLSRHCSTEKPNSNLYCINLPTAWDDDAVRKCFSQYGNVLSVKLLSIIPGTPGKGGLVRMASVDEAKRARDALNASLLPGVFGQTGGWVVGVAREMVTGNGGGRGCLGDG